MACQIREMLLAALTAARYGSPCDPSLVDAVAAGDATLEVDQLEFDSLAWMEFCIFIELRSGLELTPAHIEGMRYFVEIEDWVRARS
jgi:acyl carrier protein